MAEPEDGGLRLLGAMGGDDEDDVFGDDNATARQDSAEETWLEWVESTYLRARKSATAVLLALSDEPGSSPSMTTLNILVETVQLCNFAATPVLHSSRGDIEPNGVGHTVLEYTNLRLLLSRFIGEELCTYIAMSLIFIMICLSVLVGFRRGRHHKVWAVKALQRLTGAFSSALLIPLVELFVLLLARDSAVPVLRWTGFALSLYMMLFVVAVTATHFDPLLTSDHSLACAHTRVALVHVAVKCVFAITKALWDQYDVWAMPYLELARQGGFIVLALGITFLYIAYQPFYKRSMNALQACCSAVVLWVCVGVLLRYVQEMVHVGDLRGEDVPRGFYFDSDVATLAGLLFVVPVARFLVWTRTRTLRHKPALRISNPFELELKLRFILQDKLSVFQDAQDPPLFSAGGADGVAASSAFYGSSVKDVRSPGGMWAGFKAGIDKAVRQRAGLSADRDRDDGAQSEGKAQTSFEGSESDFETLRAVRKLYEQAADHLFPQSPAICLFQVYVFQAFYNEQSGRILSRRPLLKLRSRRPHYDAEFRACKVLMEMKEAASNGGVVVTFVQSERCEREARRLDRVSCIKLLDFWKEFGSSRADLEAVQVLSRTVFDSTTKAQRNYRQLIKLQPRNTQFLRHFGSFLVDILNDREAGSELLLRADALDEEKSRNRGNGNGNSGHGGRRLSEPHAAGHAHRDRDTPHDEYASGARIAVGAPSSGFTGSSGGSDQGREPVLIFHINESPGGAGAGGEAGGGGGGGGAAAAAARSVGGSHGGSSGAPRFGEVSYANGDASWLFNLPTRQLKGRSVQDLLLPPFSSHLHVIVQAFFDEGASPFFERSIRTFVRADLGKQCVEATMRLAPHTANGIDFAIFTSFTPHEGVGGDDGAQQSESQWGGYFVVGHTHDNGRIFAFNRSCLQLLQRFTSLDLDLDLDLDDAGDLGEAAVGPAGTTEPSGPGRQPHLVQDVIKDYARLRAKQMDLYKASGGHDKTTWVEAEFVALKEPWTRRLDSVAVCVEPYDYHGIVVDKVSIRVDMKKPDRTSPGPSAAQSAASPSEAWAAGDMPVDAGALVSAASPNSSSGDDSSRSSWSGVGSGGESGSGSGSGSEVGFGDFGSAEALPASAAAAAAAAVAVSKTRVVAEALPNRVQDVDGEGGAKSLSMRASMKVVPEGSSMRPKSATKSVGSTASEDDSGGGANLRKLLKEELSRQTLSPMLQKLSAKYLGTVFVVVFIAVGYFFIQESRLSQYEFEVDFLNRAGFRRYNAVSIAYAVHGLVMLSSGVGLPNGISEASLRAELVQNAATLLSIEVESFGLRSLGGSIFDAYTMPGTAKLPMLAKGLPVVEERYFLEVTSTVVSLASRLAQDPIEDFALDNPKVFALLNQIHGEDSYLQNLNATTFDYTSHAEERILSMIPIFLTAVGIALTLQVGLVMIFISPLVLVIERNKVDVLDLLSTIPRYAIVSITAKCKARLAEVHDISTESLMAEYDAPTRKQHRTSKSKSGHHKRGEKQGSTSTFTGCCRRWLARLTCGLCGRRASSSRGAAVAPSRPPQHTVQVPYYILWKLSLPCNVVLLFYALNFQVGFYVNLDYLLHIPMTVNLAGLRRATLRLVRHSLFLHFANTSFPHEPHYQVDVANVSEIVSMFRDVDDVLFTGRGRAQGLHAFPSKNVEQVNLILEDGCYRFPQAGTNPGSGGNLTTLDSCEGGGVMRGGLSAVSFQFTEQIETVLHQSETSDTPVADYLTSTALAELLDLEEFLQTQFTTSVKISVEGISKQIAQDQMNRNIILGGTLFLTVAIYIFVVRDVLRSLDQTLRRTRRLLLMIPEDLFGSLESLKDFVQNQYRQRRI